jgi:hypothetical protein
MATHVEKDNRSWVFRTELPEPLENTTVPTSLVAAQTNVETTQHSPKGMLTVTSLYEALANVS